MSRQVLHTLHCSKFKQLATCYQIVGSSSVSFRKVCRFSQFIIPSLFAPILMTFRIFSKFYGNLKCQNLIFLYAVLERKSEKTKIAWPKNAQLKMLRELACLSARTRKGPNVSTLPLGRKCVFLKPWKLCPSLTSLPLSSI